MTGDSPDQVTRTWSAARGPAAHVPRRQLQSLQAVRAVAALLVVMFHMNVHTLPDTLSAPSLWRGFDMGYAGVEVFFVLSGFIMFYVHSGDFGRPDRFWSYLSKRFTRIYPFFWLVLVLIVLLRLGSGGEVPGALTLAVSAMLLPFKELHVLGVQWTLSFEMLFYLIFGLLILNLRIGLLLGGLWFAICAILALIGSSTTAILFLFSAYNLLFLLGLLAAMLWPRVTSGAPVLFGLGIMIFLVTGLGEALGGVEYYKPLRTLLYGVGGAFIIAALAALENAARLRVPQFLVFLGNASYAIYLIHIAAMSITAFVLKKLGLGDLPTPVLAILLFVGAMLAGGLLHVFAEKPIISALRRGRIRRAAAT
ncbi:acyltransferase family protein [Sulfitobacter aestuarii]|uniref:Acyltransferase family protein n=1 Tax=Sulfitobacter aestuarii TaxID=2161676 RepID=A0ABW5U2C4_9RHOB